MYLPVVCGDGGVGVKGEVDALGGTEAIVVTAARSNGRIQSINKKTAFLKKWKHSGVFTLCGVDNHYQVM